MLIKIHKSYRNVIAICDSNLLGKKFEEGKKQIDLTGEFFNGEEKSELDILEIIKDASTEDATFNIVGEKAVQLALKAGIIDKKGIKKIQGIPIALTLL
jgi:hypothetical protein